MPRLAATPQRAGSWRQPENRTCFNTGRPTAQQRPYWPSRATSCGYSVPQVLRRMVARTRIFRFGPNPKGQAQHLQAMMMKKLAVATVLAAVVVLIVGLAVEGLGGLIGVAPVLLAVAGLLFFLSRSGGHRIPR